MVRVSGMTDMVVKGYILLIGIKFWCVKFKGRRMGWSPCCMMIMEQLFGYETTVTFMPKGVALSGKE